MLALQAVYNEPYYYYHYYNEHWQLGFLPFAKSARMGIETISNHIMNQNMIETISGKVHSLRLFSF